jgi:lipopolysaccharide/colanic/teichoic acid biosynthesis glycosyltransferase
VWLLLLLPVFLVVGVAIAWADGVPVVFRQVRVGRRGRDFVLVKFRTMRSVQGAERGSFEAGNVSRVTGFGRILRKSKLDELPQLWNVLKGDMSLVGPRPEVRKWVDAYPERWACVHTVRPGITDPASIVYRNEEEILAAAADPERCYREEILPRKLDLYDEYVRNRTFWGDVRILFRTVWVVVARY